MNALRRTSQAFALTGITLLCLQSGAADRTQVYRPDLSGPDRLIANEYAHWNPGDPRTVRSPEWDVTSGSLFLRDGTGWTGPPDAARPDIRSANGTGSSVFRATTKRHSFLDAFVVLRVRNLGLTSRGRMAPSSTDGIHVFLRWHSPEDLYVVSLNRRDERIVVKRKTPGGTVNGGTYATLGETAYPVPYGAWQTFRIAIENTAGRTVSISIGNADRTLLRVVDRGGAAPPNLTAGAVGLRADNCDFQFADFQVRSAGTPAGTVIGHSDN
ncbi:hypothetical protein GCM10020358_52500 [Amorphoplanes nipponensis]|uniref:3-keto-disaccharide hydrolase domain-containing protein n=1 Tax=Actinoplanes nipponensis TaxID=135950 RepID=A0A919MPK6_9ACTN|nr:hypothetical protein [Actinoplanes nipponensis]GIE49608.1 hypothetical protein Ani05nite_31420 [Actinoplanes nipponensis]